MRSCPICEEKFESEADTMKHFVREHEETVKTLLKLDNDILEWRYFICSLKLSFDDMLTERWYNS